MNDMWDSTGCFQIQFEFSGMRLRSLNDKIKLTLFYIRIYKSCNHRDLMEEYNSLTVLMLMLSSWRNRYHDKLWAPWKPLFIKYLGIAWNVVYILHQMYEVCTTNFARVDKKTKLSLAIWL